MLIQPATAKLKREEEFPAAGKCTAVITAPTVGRQAGETASVGIPIAENKDNCQEVSVGAIEKNKPLL